MMDITENHVTEILRQVVHPASGKDIMAMDLVRDLKVGKGKISFALEFGGFNDPVKSSLKKACVALLQEKFGKDTEVDVDIRQQLRPVSQSRPKYLPRVHNIIAIASGKGGVGKSTVAVNLAVAFAAAGKRTGLIDADIFGPSVPRMMKAESLHPEVTRINGKDTIIPAELYGVRTLSIGFFVNPNDATIWRGPMASGVFQQLLGDADWGELDYMFVDLPPGTSDIHLTLVQSVPVTGAVIVTTPQAVALADAIKGINMFRNTTVNVPVLGLIENMSWFTPEELPQNRYYIFGKDGCLNLADETGIPLLGQIPLVQGIREGSDNGEPVVLQEGPASEAFKAVADRLAAQIARRNSELEPTRIVEITKTSGSA